MKVMRMAGKDVAEKILEAYDDVFADIVNGLLFGGETVIRPEELEDQPPRAAYRAEGQLRELERDVAKRWTRSNIRIACIGIENQSEPDADMPLRVLGYDGAEYRAQLLKGNRSRPRYPVVTLVLYFGYKRRWDKPLTLHEAANVPDLFKPYVPDMKINLFEIAWLSHEQVSRFRSDFRVVADYFVQMREKGEYNPEAIDLEHVQAVLQLLNVMTQGRQFEEVYNDSADKGEVRNMCEWLDKMEKKYKEQGIQQGMVQGADEQARTATYNLYSMGLKPEDIARALNRSLSVVQQWLAAGTA